MEKIKLTDIQKRKLKNYYVIVYVLTKTIKVRSDMCITSKKLCIVFGLDIIGNRQVLGIYFDNDNDSRFWLEKFEDFQARNLKNILFFVTSPNKNIERGIRIVYNDVKIIHSPDVTFESIARFLADRPSRKMKVALKDLFLLKDYNKYKVDIEIFKEVYVDNNLILIMLDKNNSEIKTFYQYSQSLRGLFYPYYTLFEMKKFLNKLNTRDPLCTNINEVINFCLPYVNSFEVGRSYSKKDWLSLIDLLYKEYKERVEEYLNV